MGLLQTPADIFRLRGEARHGATQAVGVGDAAAMEDLYSIDANVAVAADLLDRADREEAETHAQRLGTKVSVSTPRKTDSAARGHRADVHMAAAEALRDGGCPLRCWKAADRGGQGCAASVLAAFFAWGAMSWPRALARRRCHITKINARHQAGMLQLARPGG
jgi:hypothetical protein